MENQSKLEVPPRRLHGDYWHFSEAGDVKLTGFQCTECGAGYLPAIATCSKCRAKSFRPLPLSSQGKLYTYTIVHGSGGVWPDVYTIGYVDYQEEGVRVCGHIKETDPKNLTIGMSMQVEKTVLYKDKDGSNVECFRFHAAESGQ